MKPIIGIVSKYFKGDEELDRADSKIRNEIKQAVFDNGGIAIGILSPNEDIQFAQDNWLEFDNLINKKDLNEELKLCDGIILQGGNQNEAFENYVAKYCYDNEVPCLGICAGQNSIVRALGGTVKLTSNPEKHSQSSLEYVHGISIDKDSIFYKIVGKDSMMVNSWHKRVIDEWPSLNVVGVCDDGYPDVIEAPNKKYYIGVRFHPEALYKKDVNMNNIFKSFINACKENKD